MSIYTKIKLPYLENFSEDFKYFHILTFFLLLFNQPLYVIPIQKKDKKTQFQSNNHVNMWHTVAHTPLHMPQ